MAITYDQLHAGHAYTDGDRILVCTERSFSGLARDAVQVPLLTGWDPDGCPRYHPVALAYLHPVVDSPTALAHPRPRFAFDSVPAIFRHWRLTKKNYNKWRHIGPIAGQINGLDESRGVLWCTDGIMCIIELSSDRYYEGHIGWFVPATQDDEINLAVKLLSIKHEDEEATEHKPKISLTDYAKIG